jgi:hypothetical protein
VGFLLLICTVLLGINKLNRSTAMEMARDLLARREQVGSTRRPHGVI